MFTCYIEKVKAKVAQSCPTLRPHGLYSLWNSPGQNTGVGSLSLLQGSLPNPGIEPSPPTLQVNSLPAESILVIIWKKKKKKKPTLRMLTNLYYLASNGQVLSFYLSLKFFPG